MVNLEILNRDKPKDNSLSMNSIDVIKDAFLNINIIKDNLLSENDLYEVKNKTYIKKSWLRKLALAFSITTEVIKESRIESWDKVIYNFTVRATTPLWRFTEASSSCSSTEKDFTNVEHEVRAISQTRATNRAISDIIWIYEVLNKDLGKNVPKTETNEVEAEKSDSENITDRQKKLLTKLITAKYQDKDIRDDILSRIDTLSKNKAGLNIRKLIEEGIKC